MSNLICSNVEGVNITLPTTSNYNAGQEKENANHSKLSDVSREFRELNKEIFKTVLAGDNSGLNNTNNSLGVGVFLDDTWLNKASSPDTSENFHLKLNEIKKKAQTPISKQPKPKHTFINNPLKKTNLRITTANINSNYDDVVDSLDTAEETNEKINQLYAHPVKQNNLDELNKRVYFTPTHSREYVNNKSFNPSFIGNSNMNINLSTGISTNESNESFDSGTFQKYREERGMRTSTYSNSAHKKINFNLALGCTMGNSMYPPMMQQYYPVNPCNLNYNFMRPENYENLNNIHNLPENAFTYSYMNKFNSEKKKKKNSKEEIDQNVFVINIENIVYGKDLRTTVMIRHIPNKYSSSCLLEEINLKFKGKYDFFYLPMDFENQCNLGYAFINFVDPLHIISFYYLFKSRKWKKYKSHKECDLSYAKFQGKVELTSHLEKSFVMNKMDDDKKPLILNCVEPLPKIEIPSEFYEIITRLYPHHVNKIIFLNK